MEATELRLAELVASRLSHDYITPVTAISNAIELQQSGIAAAHECMEIIEASVQNALADLEFARIAFGSYGENDEMSLNRVLRIIANYFDFENEQPTINYGPGHPSRGEVKLWFLALLCVQSGFSSLGALAIEKTDDGVIIRAQGRSLRDDTGRARSEDDWLGVNPTSSRNVQFPLFFTEIEKQGFEYVKKQRDDEFTLKIWR